MKNILFSFLLTVFLGASGIAANRYILYDPACMDRLEYAYQNSTNKSDYVVYHVNTFPGEKIILEVGTESQTPQNFLPPQFIRCSNSTINEELVNSINSNIDRVFIVVKRGEDQYYISPITYASRYLRAEDFVYYDSPKYRFQFNLKTGTVGENISYKNPKAEVYFEGKLQNSCSGEYIFRQYSEFSGNPHTDIILAPEVGILEERSGINVEDALKNTLRLERVNGKSLTEYLAQICGRGISSAATTGAGTQESMTERAVPSEFIVVEPTVPAGGGASGTLPNSGQPSRPMEPELPAAASSSASVTAHTVAKGETLFSISRKYNVTVGQLQAWNDKGNSTLILKGEKLIVSKPAENLTAKSGGDTPPSYEQLGGSSAASLKSTIGGGPYHVVQRGETVASIAMRYGYTEARFREFNGLDRNDVAIVGTALRTNDCNCPDGNPNSTGNSNNLNAGSLTSNQNTAQPNTNTFQPGSSGLPTEMNTSGGRIGISSSFDDNRFSGQFEDEYLNTPDFTRAYKAPSGQAAGTGAFSSQPVAPIEPVVPEGQNLQARSTYGNSSANSDTFYSRSPQPGMSEYGPTTYRRIGNTGNREYYVVKEGDTLFRIARMHNVTVEHLRQVNNLGANEVIIPYQKIYLN